MECHLLKVSRLHAMFCLFASCIKWIQLCALNKARHTYNHLKKYTEVKDLQTKNNPRTTKQQNKQRQKPPTKQTFRLFAKENTIDSWARVRVSGPTGGNAWEAPSGTQLGQPPVQGSWGGRGVWRSGAHRTVACVPPTQASWPPGLQGWRLIPTASSGRFSEGLGASGAGRQLWHCTYSWTAPHLQTPHLLCLRN